MAADKVNVPVRRKRGNSAGINPGRIVAVARDLDPDTLTLQSVADELGVDRKAVSYHVSDRDALLELLAVDAFASRFGATVISSASDWREAIRAIAISTKDCLIDSGSLATYFHLRGSADVALIQPAEIVLEKLFEAGFTEQDAARTLTMVINSAMGFARDIVMNSREGGHPQGPELRQALMATDPTAFSALRHLDEAQYALYDDAQFEYTLDVLIWGFERRLQATSAE